jgi:hypothetical protein
MIVLLINEYLDQWWWSMDVSKSGLNVFIQNFGSYYNSVGANCSFFHPHGCIVSGHQNKLIPCQSTCKFD